MEMETHLESSEGPARKAFSGAIYCTLGFRRQPDKPSGAIYCTLGLPRSSLEGLPRLAVSKPNLQKMAPGGVSGWRLKPRVQ